MATLLDDQQTYDVVSNMECLHHYKEDIVDALVDLIDMVLEKECLEASAAKRCELARLYLWLVEFEAAEKAEQTASSQSSQSTQDNDMRLLIKGLKDRFVTWAANKAGSTDQTSFDPLLKKYNVEKITKSKKRHHRKSLENKP